LIPKDQISKQNILDAIAEIDRNGVPEDRKAIGFDLIYQGKAYPPKFVLSLATKYATGKELSPDKFSGGEETNTFLAGMGFEINPRPPITERLFVITASNRAAKRHVEETIANSIAPAICSAHFPADVLAEVEKKSTDGKFYAWGAKPGEGNERNWNALQPGDYILLYQDGSYTYWSRVISKHRNAAFAEAVWRRDVEDNQTWEFMYFLQSSVPVQCSAESVADFLPARYQGFTPISADRVQRIVSRYGSIDKFINERIQATATYLLLRSNEESGWSDKVGHSYHYGNTVANHTVVAKGAKFLLDRVDRETRRIFAVGTIGDITEEPGFGKATKTFRAAYQQYRPLRPPRLLTKMDESLLASLAGYNVQHSIHKISREVFEKLSAPARAWIFQAVPSVYNLRAAIRALKIDTFLVKRYENEIKCGDRVYLWEAGGAGIVGIAEVIEEPRVRPPQPESLPFQLDAATLGGEQVRALLRLLGSVDPSISRERLLSLPEFSNLSILKQAQGTNFKVTPVEAEAIEQLLEHDTKANGNLKPERTDVTNANNPKNLILYGPPGTGKTYQTVSKALEILDRQYFDHYKDDRKRLKGRFDEHMHSGHIEFVTFHQSFAYEDFVEGIRAETTKDGQLRYEVKDGIFKELCDRARRAPGQEAAELGLNSDPRIWKISIDRAGSSPTRDYCLANNQARIGWTDTGDLRTLDADKNEYFKNLGTNDKSSLMAFYKEIRTGDILLCIKSSTEVLAIGVVKGDYTFDPNAPEPAGSNFPHVRPVQWIFKDLSLSLGSLNDDKAFTQKTVYELTRVTWDRLLQLLREQGYSLPLGGEKPRFVLIIDEINRGNISRIFGELITLVEASKREGAEEALEVTLPYSKERFSVPANVYLVGTMNTADRSLTGLDIALRRRFIFEEISPQPDLLEGIVVEGVNVGALLSVINERIEVLLDRDHCLGHSYFLPLRTDNSLSRLGHIFEQEIIPLLREYFFDDSERIRWVLNDHRKPSVNQFLVKPESDLTKLLGDEPGMPTETRRLQLNAKAFSDIQSYRGIIDPVVRAQGMS